MVKDLKLTASPQIMDGEIGLNGAAVTKEKHDFSYYDFINLNPEEAAVWEPRLVLVSNSNLNHELIKSPQ